MFVILYVELSKWVVMRPAVVKNLADITKKLLISQKKLIN